MYCLKEGYGEDATAATMPPRHGEPETAYWDRVLLVLLAISLLLNVLLGLETLRPHEEGVEAGTGPLSGPAIGASVPSLQVESLDGVGQRISFESDSRPTVIYIFSPSCDWCERNVANIRALASERSGAFRFVGVSLTESSEDHLIAEQLGFEVFISPGLQTLSAYGLRGTPQTIVVSTDGTVVRSWTGAYGGRTGQMIERFFGLKLPGLIQAKSSSWQKPGTKFRKESQNE
jgi:hypothetical protein